MPIFWRGALSGRSLPGQRACSLITPGRCDASIRHTGAVGCGTAKHENSRKQVAAPTTVYLKHKRDYERYIVPGISCFPD